MPDIFNYTDYRKFLFDWFEKKKQANPCVSYRMIANKVGYKAPSYLPSLLTGKINMSLGMCLKFGSEMKLSKKANDYFQNMVLFCNAPSHEEKQIYFDKMRSFKEATVHIVASDQYRYYEKWYHSATRALLDFFPFRDEYEMIGKLLIPAVSPQDICASVHLLQELKMIALSSDGCYHPTDDVISSGYDATGMAINTFLFNSLRLSESALGKFRMDERTFSCLTLGISKKGYDEIRQELREFRRKVMKIATDDTADRIYQFGFQLFPLSHRYSNGGKK
jgi:uncharacterized protein (TIGR02147 family)